jgi:PAS domain S-box-containing protein
LPESHPPLDPGALALLDAVPERLLVCDARGRIVHAHPLACTLLGAERSELMGRGPEAWLLSIDGHPADRARLAEVVARGADVATAAVVRHPRVQLHVLLVARAQEVAGRALWLVSLRDRPAELTSRESRISMNPSALEELNVYRAVFERAPVGIFHGDAGGIITAVNDAFASIIGAPKRVLVGLAIRTLPDKNIVACMELALTGEVARYEGPYRSATGQKTTDVRLVFAPIFDEAGRTVATVGIVADITAQKDSERALKRSLDALDRVIEQAPDAIAVHKDGKFVLVNHQMCEMFGEPADKLLQRPISDFIHPDELETLNQRIPQIAGGASLRPHEYRMRRADGSYVRVEVKSIAFEHEGQPSVLVFGRDVTERRELEMRLQQADRMASVGTLAAGVAHEINNPLGYVLMTAELLVRRLKAGDTTKLADGLTRIQEGCDRIRIIVRDLSTFSRRSEEIVTSVEVNQAVATSVNMVKHTVRHKAQLLVDLADDLPRVRGDQARLSQVFVNLLVNAAQAIPDGAADSHTVHISTETDGQRVRVRVRDDGDGMPAHVEQRIFEPFFTTKAPGVGSGLGLAICHGIVRSHGGTIRVRTQQGKGSEFIVDLPGESSAPLRSSVHDQLRPEPSLAPPSHILIIDDEAAFADVLRDTLAERHRVSVARSGLEGVETLLEREEPDLVLCDVMMPDITGLGVFEVVSEQRPRLAQRFVFMTGGAVTERAREMLAFTDRPVLDKPFSRQDVERILVAITDRET